MTPVEKIVQIPQLQVQEIVRQVNVAIPQEVIVQVLVPQVLGNSNGFQKRGAGAGVGVDMLRGVVGIPLHEKSSHIVT